MKIDNAVSTTYVFIVVTSVFAIILAAISTLRLFRRRFDPIWLKFPVKFTIVSVSLYIFI